jgi:hypothetical protein
MIRKPKSAILEEKLKKAKETPTEPIVAVDQIPENELSLGEEAYIFVTQTILGKSKEEAKTIKIRPFATTPARVEVHAKRFAPLGPNEGTITTAVTISMPCYKEEIISCYKQVDSIVDKIMIKKLKDMGLGNNG